MKFHSIIVDGFVVFETLHEAEATEAVEKISKRNPNVRVDSAECSNEQILEVLLERIRCLEYGDRITGARFLKEENGQSVVTELPRSFLWGNTIDKDGNKQPVVWRALAALDSDHLKAILKTQTHISEPYKKEIQRVLDNRDLMPHTKV